MDFIWWIVAALVLFNIFSDSGNFVWMLIGALVLYNFLSDDDGQTGKEEAKDNKPEVVAGNDIGVQEGRGMGNVIPADTPAGRFPPKPVLKPQEQVEEMTAVPNADDLFKDVFDETLFDF